MKNILKISAAAVAITALVAPVIIMAQQAVPAEITQCTMRHNLTGTTWTDKGVVCPAQNAACVFNSTTNTCGVCCVFDTIYTVTDWIFIIVTAIAIIFVLLGAYNILTAGGNVEKVNTGRSYIIYAIVGELIALLARAIPFIVRNIISLS
jgi:hypothetical protein